MKAERWQQISRIFNAAMSLDGVDRAAFVEEKCGTDNDLRDEVERLLESHSKAEDEGFIGGLAVEDVAEHLTAGEQQYALQKGQQFGAYLILNHLGSGGMGEVYLAKDSRLDRTVALKILASEVAADKRRMQRFHQEAKVASSLNQPNILTIYEFGEVDNLTFLATEFVDGETLRDYVRGKRLKLTEILDISIQILAALDAAHEAKIVHRDIKPENVMIRRRDHVVKVLDFGLAKLTEKKKHGLTEFSSEEEVVTEFKTAPGLIMGTVNYMSPEQAQAKAVDARSDIWSTGIMLYEMIAGAKPFGGITSAHTIVEILEKEPASLTLAGATGVPAELERIVAKSIAKDPDERYQSAKDMLIDLRNLKKRLELNAQTERSPAYANAPSASTKTGMTASTIENPAAARVTQPRTVERPKTRSGLVIALAAIVALVAAGLAINAWRSTRNVPAVEPETPIAPAVERTLTYWITVQKFRDDKPHQDPFYLRGEINFEAAYRIRLNVRSNRRGYLYVLNEGPPNTAKQLQYVALFPSSTANNGSEVISSNQSVIIPEQTWFRFDEEQGVEKVWLVFSEDPLPELEGIKAFASAQTRGLITDPVLNRAANGFLISYAQGNKVTVEKGEKHTILKTAEKVLVYAIRLEHH